MDYMILRARRDSKGEVVSEKLVRALNGDDARFMMNQLRLREIGNKFLLLKQVQPGNWTDIEENSKRRPMKEWLEVVKERFSG